MSPRLSNPQTGSAPASSKAAATKLSRLFSRIWRLPSASGARLRLLRQVVEVNVHGVVFQLFDNSQKGTRAVPHYGDSSSQVLFYRRTPSLDQFFLPWSTERELLSQCPQMKVCISRFRRFGGTASPPPCIIVVIFSWFFGRVSCCVYGSPFSLMGCRQRMLFADNLENTCSLVRIVLLPIRSKAFFAPLVLSYPIASKRKPGRCPTVTSPVPLFP